MSESNGSSVWVGDLDRCISTDFDRANEREAQQELLEIELDALGELRLLAGKAISARQLYQKGIPPLEWRHALHQSEMTIRLSSVNVRQSEREHTDSPVIDFLKGMLNLGRPYAISRYARWERLYYPSALTATLPHGIRALVNQLLESEGIARTREVDASIRSVLESFENSDATAYRRTGVLQASLHQIANDAPGHPGGAKLNRDSMRTMLSLARLYFSTVELRLKSIDDLRLLLKNYELEREAARRGGVPITITGRLIKSWRVRHIQPLVNLYPYSIRHGLQRALAHESADFDRTALVNELALAHCGIFRMRAAGKVRVIRLSR